MEFIPTGKEEQRAHPINRKESVVHESSINRDYRSCVIKALGVHVGK